MGLIAAGLLWALSGCSKHKPVLPPDVKLNSEPNEQYEIVVDLDEDPGDIAYVTAGINYKISNAGCVPVDYGRSIGGSRPIFREEKRISVERHGKIFSARVFKDLLKDDDYYGLGICRWEIDGFGMQLHRGVVTNIVGAPLSDMHVGSTKYQRVRCAYDGSTAGSNGLDDCLMESAPLHSDRRKFFTISVKTRSVGK